MENKIVKTVSAYRISHSLLGGHADDEREQAQFSEYDENGNKIIEVAYADGEPEQEVKRIYSGTLPKEEIINFLTDEVSETTAFTHNADGLVESSVKKYSDGSTEITEYEYIGKKLSRKTTKNDDGEIEAQQIYRYEGDKVISHEVSEYDDVVSLSEYRYNENGDLLEESRWNSTAGKKLKVIYETKGSDKFPDLKVYNEEGKVVEAMVYRYNDKGQLEEEIIESTYKGYKRFATRYEYDEKGNVILEELMDHNNVIRKRIRREYGENGLLTAEHLHDENPDTGMFINLTTVYEYTYF